MTLGRTINTHMRDGEDSEVSQGLREMIADCLRPESIVAEIGVYSGESTLLFMKSGLVSKLFAVDAWTDNWMPEDEHSNVYPMRDVRVAFFDNTEDYRERIITFAMPSLVVAEFMPDRYFDLIYIDAVHRYREVMQDIQAWVSKVKNGGYIAGHDYQRPFPGVIEAVDEMFDKPDKVYRDTSWVVQL